MSRVRPSIHSAVSAPSPLVAYGSAEQLMSAFLNSPNIGVALCDRRLRYNAINKTLASMNGIPADLHLGKPLHQILGEVAAECASACEAVFASGGVAQKEIAGILPARNVPGRWIETYFPVKDGAGKVEQIGVIVIEMPDAMTTNSANLNGLPLISEPQGVSCVNVLRSWKEIARYAAASVRTVQRWERQFGLPVRRVQASKGAVVFAFQSDLERWLRDQASGPRSSIMTTDSARKF